MINIGFGANLVLGFLFVLGVTVLYSVRIVRPELSRDEDIFFTTLGLIYSCILMIHGWRLDPILLFSQVLIIGISIAAGWENLRLRGLIAKKVRNQIETVMNDFKLE